jgi:hypothetical protein
MRVLLVNNSYTGRRRPGATTDESDTDAASSKRRRVWDTAAPAFIPLAMDTIDNTPTRDIADSGTVECWDDDDASQPVRAVIPYYGQPAVDIPSQPTTSTGSGRAWIPRRVEMDMEVDAP